MTPEIKMDPITLALIVGVVCTGLGIGGTLGVQAMGGKSEQVTDVTITTDAPETVEAVGGVVDSVVAEDVTDAETRAAVVEQSPQSVLAQAVVDLEDPATTAAAYGYAACIAGAQGKQEGAGAFGCPTRGTSLDNAVNGLSKRSDAASSAAFEAIVTSHLSKLDICYASEGEGLRDECLTRLEQE